MKHVFILLVSAMTLFSCSQGSNNDEKPMTSSEETLSIEQTEMTEEEQLKAAVAENPDNASANYNLAIYYYNQGVQLITEMTSEEQAEADSLTFDKMMSTQERVEGLFRKALPYAQAAHRIDSANAQAITMLSGIHFGLNDMEKSEAYKAMLNQASDGQTHTYEAM